MKKTFKLTHEKLNKDRLVDATRHEIRKYIKRERNRVLPKEMDYWDFDCRFGADEPNAEVIHLSEIDQSINRIVAQELESFYLEILAKPAKRMKKTEPDEE